MANESHPFSRFSIGNIETLMETPRKQGLDSYKALKNFHKLYYSANIMTAVIISNDDLKYLEEIAFEKFKVYTNNHLKKKRENIKIIKKKIFL